MAGVSFERIADRYEATRGGLDRGERFLAALGPLLVPGSQVLEIGVGTGAIAAPLRAAGHTVLGVDLSPAMLATARDREVPVVQADATRLPVGDHVVEVVLAVWAVHLIGDTEALAAEVRRVLRADGRFLVIAAAPDVEPSDLSDAVTGLERALGRGWDRSERLAPRLAGLGLAHRGDHPVPATTMVETPQARAAAIERRDWSSLWDLDDDTWADVVAPALTRIRALPDQGRARRTRHVHQVSVYGPVTRAARRGRPQP